MLETIVKTETTKNEPRNKEQPYYELYLLLHPSALDTDVHEIEKKLTTLLEEHGGKFKQLKKFIRYELAYPIKKSAYAYAGSIYFWADPEALRKIEAALKVMNLAILRSIILHIDPRSQKQALKNIDALLEQKLMHESKATDEERGRAPATQVPVVTKREEPLIKSSKEKKEDGKITLEDIDKKLDEIMGNL